MTDKQLEEMAEKLTIGIVGMRRFLSSPAKVIWGSTKSRLIKEFKQIQTETAREVLKYLNKEANAYNDEGSHKARDLIMYHSMQIKTKYGLEG